MLSWYVNFSHKSFCPGEEENIVVFPDARRVHVITLQARKQVLVFLLAMGNCINERQKKRGCQKINACLQVYFEITDIKVYPFSGRKKLEDGVVPSVFKHKETKTET